MTKYLKLWIALVKLKYRCWKLRYRPGRFRHGTADNPVVFGGRVPKFLRDQTVCSYLGHAYGPTTMLRVLGVELPVAHCGRCGRRYDVVGPSVRVAADPDYSDSPAPQGTVRFLDLGEGGLASALDHLPQRR